MQEEIYHHAVWRGNGRASAQGVTGKRMGQGQNADSAVKRKEVGQMLAYGVKDLTTGEDICHKATRQQVADLIGAPVGRVPSMAKAGRLHDGRYLIRVEG